MDLLVYKQAAESKRPNYLHFCGPPQVYMLNRTHAAPQCMAPTTICSLSVCQFGGSMQVRSMLIFALVSYVLFTFGLLIIGNVNRAPGFFKNVADGWRPWALGDNGHDVGTDDLLCMFTTFKPVSYKTQVYKNVLSNWMSLARRGVVRPILYDVSLSPINFNDSKIMNVSVTNVTTPTSRDNYTQEIIDVALELGWHVFNLSRVSPLGVPYFKDMFFEAAEHFPACKFYGFANGDIMFDEGLIRTLEAVHKVIDALNETLLIGRRTNVLTANLTSDILTAPSAVKQLAETIGTLYHNYAQDYFIVYKNRFPWHVIPNIVIGRLAYDNFIVAKALEHRLSVVDVTNTTVALHQTDMEGNRAGAEGWNGRVNQAIIGKFSFFKGSTANANYYTAEGDNSTLTKETDWRPTVNVFRKCAVVKVKV